MAVIMKMRNKLGVFIVVLIALTIFAFLLQDAINSDTSMLRPNSNVAGIINGKSVSIQDFDKKVQEATDNYRLSSNNSNIDDETVWQIRNQTWNQYVNDVLMGAKYEKLGVQVTSDELLDMVQGSNPHSAVVQSFSDPQTGQFNPEQVAAFIQNLDKDETGETRQRWLNFEKFLKEDRIKSKFNDLVKNGMYTPSWMATENYSLSGTTVSFDYVFLPYTDVPDADVTVTDDELQDYLDANKSEYMQDEETRSIEYISYDIKPTQEDTLRIKNKLEELFENFQKTNSDSAFLKSYSQLPYDPKYYGIDELQSSMKDTLFKIDTNAIIGPYIEESYWKYAKLLDRKLIPDSVRAKHIFVSIAGVKDQTGVQQKRAIADSLLKEIKEKGALFDTLLAKHSDDAETKAKGGDMGWIKPGEKFPTIDVALFYKHKQGDIFIVPSDEDNKRGFHIIQITEAKPVKDAVKVAFLAKEIAASIETERGLYAEASKFASANHTAQLFRDASKDMSPRQAEGIKKNDNAVQGLNAARDVVKWVFSASEGEVSEVFSLHDKYVVALLSGVKEKGLAALDDVRTQIEVEVKKEKKADVLKGKLKGQTDLNATAGATGKVVETATGLSFGSNYIGDAVGSEPGVVARAIAMNEGETSAPIAGDNGVFVIKITSKIAPPQLTDVKTQKKQSEQKSASLVDFSLQEAIRKSADIKDERYKFY